MTALAPLTIIGIVVAALLGIVGMLPFPGLATDPAQPVDESYSEASVQQLGERFTLSYAAIMNDILSFQKNPDLARAEAKRQQIVVAAEAIGIKFKDLEQRLLVEKATLEAQLQAITSDTTTTP